MPIDKLSFFQSIKKLALYGINGAINTVTTYVLFLSLSTIMDYRISIVFSYIPGVFLSYYLNGKTVFRQNGKLWIFIIINMLMLLINIIITWNLVETMKITKEIAQIIAILVVFLASFVLNRRFVFLKINKNSNGLED